MTGMHHHSSLCLLLALLCACGAGGRDLTEAPDERAANEVLVALDREGIAATKAKSSGRDAVWTVQVEPEQLARAHAVLERLDLPRSEHSGFSAMLEDSGVIPSKSNEHARLMFATSEELARTLEQHERVLSARVHVVQPQESLGERIRIDPRGGRPTASVMIRYVPSRDARAGAREAAPAGARQLGAEGENRSAADLFQKTLREVFLEIADSSHERLVAAIRKELRQISSELADELGDELGSGLALQMKTIGRELKGRIEGLFAGEDPSKLANRTQRILTSLEEMLQENSELITSSLRSELRAQIGGYRFRDDSEATRESANEPTPSNSPVARAEAGSPGDLIGRLERAVQQAVEATRTDELVEGLLQPGDTAEVRFVKQMMHDFYKLPPAVRELAEKRIEPENPDWPFSRTEVRMLVAHAVEGMWPWDVNVVFSPIEGRPLAASFRSEGEPAADASEARASGAEEAGASAPGLAQETQETEARPDLVERLGYLAAALGASTVVLLVLLARERRRNAELERQLRSSTPA